MAIVLAKLVSLFFKNLHALFSFLTRSLIDNCQIVTDTCIITFQSLFGSLLNHFYHYANENVLPHRSVYGRFCCIYSPKSFGFFRNEFRQV